MHCIHLSNYSLNSCSVHVIYQIICGVLQNSILLLKYHQMKHMVEGEHVIDGRRIAVTDKEVQKLLKVIPSPNYLLLWVEGWLSGPKLS